MMRQKIFENLLRILRIVESFYDNFEQVEKIIESTHRFNVKILIVKLIIQECYERN